MHPDTDQRIPGTVGTAFDYRLRYYLALTPLEDPARLRRVRAMSSIGSSATTRTITPGPGRFSFGVAGACVTCTLSPLANAPPVEHRRDSAAAGRRGGLGA